MINIVSSQTSLLLRCQKHGQTQKSAECTTYTHIREGGCSYLPIFLPLLALRRNNVPAKESEDLILGNLHQGLESMIVRLKHIPGQSAWETYVDKMLSPASVKQSEQCVMQVRTY